MLVYMQQYCFNLELKESHMWIKPTQTTMKLINYFSFIVSNISNHLKQIYNELLYCCKHNSKANLYCKCLFITWQSM